LCALATLVLNVQAEQQAVQIPYGVLQNELSRSSELRGAIQYYGLASEAESLLVTSSGLAIYCRDGTVLRIPQENLVIMRTGDITPPPDEMESLAVQYSFYGDVVSDQELPIGNGRLGLTFFYVQDAGYQLAAWKLWAVGPNDEVVASGSQNTSAQASTQVWKRRVRPSSPVQLDSLNWSLQPGGE